MHTDTDTDKHVEETLGKIDDLMEEASLSDSVVNVPFITDRFKAFQAFITEACGHAERQTGHLKRDKADELLRYVQERLPLILSI